MQKILLIAASLVFYGYANLKCLLLLLGSGLINYIFFKGNKERKKSILILSIIFNLALLFYFKYLNFFISNLNRVFSSDINLVDIFLPLGISFYTFELISFQVDYFKGSIQNSSFIDYLVYLTFFPKIAQGPIAQYNELMDQFHGDRTYKMDFDNLSVGILRFSIGMFKKVIVADTFGRTVGWGFSNIDAATSMDFILVMLSYTFQLYFDFSGYCDMAIGISQMLNIKLIENFNSPYKSYSIPEFWRRWHTTLTRFFQNYVYFPLGGSRKGSARTYINIMIVFILSGAWHGAKWTFIAWGILHGIANCLTRVFKKQYEKLSAALQWLITFIFINFTWLLFRSEGIHQAWHLLKKICSLSNMAISGGIISAFDSPLLGVLYQFPGLRKINGFVTGLTMWVFLITAFFVSIFGKNTGELKYRRTVFNMIMSIIILLWSIFSLSNVSAFLYFGF